MTTQIQRRRGTTAQHSTFTGANGEVTVDTDKEVLVVHDGAQAGGYPQMRENGSNSALALGSATTPSLKFTGDPNTGIYSPGADQVSVATGGTERLRIDAAGQIEANGLGSAAAPAYSWIGDPNTGIYSSGADQVAISTNGTGRLFVDANGNVQLGGSSGFFFTAATNQIAIGGNTFVRDFTINATNAAIGLRASSGGTYSSQGLFFYVDGTAQSQIHNDGGGSILFRNTSALTERMRLDSSGRLGLGTSSPSFGLDVIGTSRVSGSARFDNGLQLKTATQNYIYFDDALSLTRNGVGDRLTIDSSGRVGIGTTSPQNPLHVTGTGGIRVSDPVNAIINIRGDLGANSYLYFAESGLAERGIIGYPAGSGDLVYRSGGNSFSSGTERVRIDSSGRLLVGTSTAFTTLGSLTAKFQVFGNSVFDTGISTALFENSNNPAQIQFLKSRSGTTGSQVVVQANDNLGRILFGGSDGTNFQTAAWIQCDVDGTPGTNDMPGRLVFSTTADGAASPTERMRIKSNGTINFSNVATYADNAAATTGGLAVGDVYRTSTGQLMIRY